MVDSLVQTRMPIVEGHSVPDLGSFDLFLTVRGGAEQHAQDFALILRDMLPAILGSRPIDVRGVI